MNKQQDNKDLASQEAQNESYILRYKGLIIGVAVVGLLGFLGYGLFNHFQSKDYARYSNQIFDFEQNTLPDLKEKKLSVKNFIIRYRELAGPMGNFSGLAQVQLQSVDLLLEQGAMTEASELLKKGLGMFKNPFVRPLFATRLAGIMEDQKRYPEAIEILQNLLSNSKGFLEYKAYLDLGRLYLLTGNKEKAKTSFTWVVQKSSERELKKMAQLYLDDLVL